MELLSTTADEPTSGKLLEKLEKPFDVVMVDYNERKLTKRTGGIRSRRESLPFSLPHSLPLPHKLWSLVMTMA